MAEKNIQMQRKNADGTFDLVYPLTKVGNVAGAAKDDDLVAHKADYVRQAGYAATNGTATAYTVTLDPAPASIVEGFGITIVPHVDCGANPTLNINGKGVIQLRNNDGESFAAGDLKAGVPYNFRKVGSYFFLSSGGGGVKIEFEDYYNDFDSALTRFAAPSLSRTKYQLRGTSIGDHALFAGSTESASEVEAYDSSLTRLTPLALSSGRTGIAAASNGGYAIFAGGEDVGAGVGKNIVDAFSPSLTRILATTLPSDIYNACGVSISGHALIGGGQRFSTTYYAGVVAYDVSLTQSILANLSVTRTDLAGASIGGHALFAGGRAAAYRNTVDAYDASLVKASASLNIGTARDNLAAASTANHAIFAGGKTGSSTSTAVSDVCAIDVSLVMATITALIQPSAYLAGVSTADYALFAGGVNGTSALDTVNSCDSSLILAIQTPLRTAGQYIGAASIGDYALFAGGRSGSTPTSNVDAYRHIKRARIPITAGSKYKFTEAVEQIAAANGTLTYDQKVTGYVKYKKGVIFNG